jgi:Nodulation protein S (NodS)
MLNIARARDSRIEWIEGDMRDPSITGKFDLLICPFNTLQLIQTNEELGQTFRAVRKLLEPNGVFSFDIYQPNLDYLDSWPSDHVVRSFTDREGRGLSMSGRTRATTPPRRFYRLTGVCWIDAAAAMPVWTSS